MRALGEQLLGVCLLEIVAADLAARDVGCDGQARHAVAVAVEQAVDQVHVAGPATAGADGEFAGQVGLGASREGAGLLVAHMDPVDLLHAAKRIGEAVQGVPGDAVDPLHAGGAKGLGHQVGNRLRHVGLRHKE